MRACVWAEHTGRYPANTGIQRVTRGLIRSLVEKGVEILPLKWAVDHVSFGPLEPEETAHLERWNGPDFKRLITGPPLSLNGTWLLVPELVSEPHRPSLKSLTKAARVQGMKVGVVFYDALPYRLSSLYPPEATEAHAHYMEFLASADIVLPISVQSGDDLMAFWLERGLGDPAVLRRKIRPCVLPGEFSESPRVCEPRSLSNGRINILSVGTVEPRKNQLRLVEAFQAAGSRLPDKELNLMIVGGCPFPELKAHLEEMIASAPRKNIRWVEKTDDAGLARLYDECDFTVYPSLAEGFGLPILESLWHGRPVICHRTGAIAETAGPGGCLTTDVTSVPDFAAAMVRMVSDESLRQALTHEAVTIPIKSWADYGAEVAELLRSPFAPQIVPATFRKPLLTISVTTYNRAAWLSHSLPLVLEQTKPYQDIIEVLVCDNASTDNTRDVVRGLGHHAHLFYHRNEKNVGMLGNLAVSCNRAKGRYVWVIGDDDLLVEGTIERVLAAIIGFPDTELLYLNYAYTHFDKPEDLIDVASLIRHARPISPRFRDEATSEIRNIATKTENCFTAIYCLIYREDHARRAFNQDVGGPPFLSLTTCVPTADYVCRHMLRRPGYWMGDPCVVVNMNVSWLRYASLYILERFPELHDLMQSNGTPAAEVDRLRANHLPNVMHWLQQIYFGFQKENLPYFSVDRLVRRYRHLPAFRQQWDAFLDIYGRALAEGVAGTQSPSLNDLKNIYINGETAA